MTENADKPFILDAPITDADMDAEDEIVYRRADGTKIKFDDVPVPDGPVPPLPKPDFS